MLNINNSIKHINFNTNLSAKRPSFRSSAEDTFSKREENVQTKEKVDNTTQKRLLMRRLMVVILSHTTFKLIV